MLVDIGSFAAVVCRCDVTKATASSGKWASDSRRTLLSCDGGLVADGGISYNKEVNECVLETKLRKVVTLWTRNSIDFRTSSCGEEAYQWFHPILEDEGNLFTHCVQ